MLGRSEPRRIVDSRGEGHGRHWPDTRSWRLPFTISVDKNAAYPEAFTSSQKEKILPHDCKLRRVKYLNNIIEQDQRFIKKKVRASQCFKCFHTAERTLEGIEAVNMMRKGQVKRLDASDVKGQAEFVASLFQVAA